MVKTAAEKLKGKATPTISVAAILGVIVQGFLGWQENKTKTAQSGFIYEVVRELKTDNDETLDKLDDIATRLARLEGRTEGLKEVVHLLQDRSLKRRERADAIEELLNAVEVPEDAEEISAEGAGMGFGSAGGGTFEGETMVEVEAAAEAPTMGKTKRKKKRRPRRAPASMKAQLPATLPDSVQAVEQAQEQLQEVFE